MAKRPQLSRSDFQRYRGWVYRRITPSRVAVYRPAPGGGFCHEFDAGVRTAREFIDREAQPMMRGKLTGKAKADFLAKMARGRRKFGAGYARLRPGASTPQLDPFYWKHFQAYANKHRASVAVRAAAWRLFKTDPAYYAEKGWPYLFDQFPPDYKGPSSNPRGRRRLPAKVERCVRAVKRRPGRKPVNPFAVCEAAAGHKRNPVQRTTFVLVARRGLEELAYAGGKFTSETRRPIYFATRHDAERERYALYRRYAVLKRWRVQVVPSSWWHHRKKNAGKAPRRH